MDSHFVLFARKYTLFFSICHTLEFNLPRKKGYIQPVNFKYKRSGIANVGKAVWFQPIETAGAIG